MRPIPPQLRAEIAKDAFMKKCVWCQTEKSIEWNHAIIYRGRQLNTWYAIVPLCSEHHRGNNGTIFADVKEYCELVAIKRGIEEIKKDCPKMNWQQRLKYLNSLYGDKFTNQSTIS